MGFDTQNGRCFWRIYGFLKQNEKTCFFAHGAFNVQNKMDYFDHFCYFSLVISWWNMFCHSWWFLSLFPEFTVFSGFVSKSDKKGVILGFVHKWSEKTCFLGQNHGFGGHLTPKMTLFGPLLRPFWQVCGEGVKTHCLRLKRYSGFDGFDKSGESVILTCQLIFEGCPKF